MIEVEKKMFEQAKDVFVGGVNSPVRSFAGLGMEPLVLESGKGAIVCASGKGYVDYLLGFGAVILGHAHEEVVEAVKRFVGNGLSFGTTTREEILFGQQLQQAMPMLEKMRFVNSGTEAVMGALRLARGFTKRNKIIKFTNAYHGHADYLLAKAGSGLASLNIPLSDGVPEDFIKNTLVVDYGDKKAVENLFKEHFNEIAAIIVEPVGGNYGVIKPDEEFLRFLREITEAHDALLVFDEIITGFRFAYRSFADSIGIKPDLVCLGKIIGGGLPIGLYGGREQIMRELAPLGKVYQASTFAGNPLVMSVGLATLNVLERVQAEYEELSVRTKVLIDVIGESAKINNIKVDVRTYKTMFSLKFSEKGMFQKFYAELLSEGVFFAPSEYEVNFISFAHTMEHVEKTIQSIKKVFDKMKK